MSKMAADPSDAVNRALKLIESHPAWRGTRCVLTDPSTGAVTVDLDVEVNLPFAWAAEGESPSGVRLLEPVTLTFPPRFPLYAPGIELRHDFNRSLAHVIPGPVTERPVPCIYDGPMSELMQRDGVAGILNQLVCWLDAAALGRLIDPVQGWEPVRRDTLADTIVVSGDTVRREVNKKGGYVFLEFDYVRADFTGDTDPGYGYHGDIKQRVVNNPEMIGSRFGSRKIAEGIIGGASVAIVIWPPESRGGALMVADTYLPETVVNFADLKTRAEDYGCKVELERSLAWLTVCRAARPWRSMTPVAFILCPRRPFHLIHQSSNIELCPYIVEFRPADALPPSDEITVRPAGHQEAVSVPLLRRMSEPSLGDPEPWPWIQVGCGSLGSKIALHLAREGRAPSAVVDNASFRAHNAARHALFPAGGSLAWFGSKAQGLADTISSLGQRANPHIVNAVSLARDSGLLQRIIPKHTQALVNSTASVTVREAFASAPRQLSLPRIIETSLFAGGKVGILTIEGLDRNPDTGDLITRAYEMIREDKIAREMIYGAIGSLQRQVTGDGCGTTTMVMSDAMLSLNAAAMALSISKIQRVGLPTNGSVRVGRTEDEESGISWQEDALLPCIRIPVEHAPGYQVHILPRAQAKISADLAIWPGVETGGVLLGRFSEAAQTFYVADVLAAPEDSTRSASLFVLGTRGLQSQLLQYSESCGNSLYCLGTWHSHLGDFGASNIDRQTATAIALGRPLPSVLMIRTPKTYLAVLAQAARIMERQGG